MVNKVKSVPLKELFENAKKKYPQNHYCKSVDEFEDHVCVTCGEPIKGNDGRKKYCRKCKPKHIVNCYLNDEDYKLFKDYYDIYGCDSVSDCLRDIILGEVKP